MSSVPGRQRVKLLAVTVALALPLLRISRAAGVPTDDELGFRYGSYNEDDSRINVTTESADFNLGLSDNVRLTGNLVVDSISGATPTGAPPQTKWPYPSYNQYYQSSYNQLFTAAVNDPNNRVLYDSGYFNSYQEYTNYVASSNPQISGQATNSANASYQSLTNSPNYHKNSVPLTHMQDHRDAFSLQMPITLGRHQITPSFSHSAESDYISFGGALNYSISFNDKNTILSAGWAINQDSVRNDLFQWVPKTTDDIFLGLVQLVSPTSYFTVNASLSFSDGYLNDPYRGVMVMDFLQTNPDDAALIPEKRPQHRNSESLYTSWTQFVTPANASYEVSYRFFHDTYGLFANTAALTWNQKIGKSLVISPMFRYYIQSAADFYYILVPETSGQLPTFYSSDYRLSEMETFTTGVKITWRVAKHLSLDASYSRFVMYGLDNVTSSSAYPSANVFSLGGRLYF